MSKYPVYLKLEGRRVVVIGGGSVAMRKLQPLVEAGARAVVVAERVNPEMEKFCIDNKAELIISGYSRQYLTGATLAIAATDDVGLNEQIYKDCQQAEVLCNVVDQPELCDFFVPAVVKAGPLQIAISTDGYCPAYSAHIRKKLEALFTEDHGRFVTELETARKAVIEKITDPDRRKAILGELVKDEYFEYFLRHGPEVFRKKADELINSGQ